jgi:hypothetical protein
LIDGTVRLCFTPQLSLLFDADIVIVEWKQIDQTRLSCRAAPARVNRKAAAFLKGRAPVGKPYLEKKGGGAGALIDVG